MGLTEIQAKIRNIELQLSDLESEIEQMKPKAKAEEIEQYKKINQIAENHKIKNKPLLTSDFTVRKSYVCSLGHLLLKRMNEKYEGLLFLTRIAKGIQCYEDVEQLYQDVIAYDEKTWEDSLMLLKEHKYSFLVDMLILANLNKTKEENHLNLIADIAEILEVPEKDLQVCAMVALAVLTNNFYILDQVPEQAKNKWNSKFTHYISAKWLAERRTKCVQKQEFSFANIYSFAKWNTRMLSERISSGATVKKGTPLIWPKGAAESAICAPKNGVVYFVDAEKEKNAGSFIDTYVVSYFDDYDMFCQWYKSKKVLEKNV